MKHTKSIEHRMTRKNIFFFQYWPTPSCIPHHIDRCIRIIFVFRTADKFNNNDSLWERQQKRIEETHSEYEYATERERESLEFYGVRVDFSCSIWPKTGFSLFWYTYGISTNTHISLYCTQVFLHSINLDDVTLIYFLCRQKVIISFQNRALEWKTVDFNIVIMP